MNTRNSNLYLFLQFAIVVMPVWMVTWFHTGDGPAHLYCARVLHDLLTGPGPATRSFFMLNPEPVPNSLVQIILSFLLGVTGVSTANRIMISMVILVFVSGYWKLVRTLSGKPEVFPVLAGLFIYCFPLKMGFYSFVAGAGMMMHTLAFHLIHRMDYCGKKIWTAIILVTLTWLTHFTGFALVALAIILFDGIQYFKSRLQKDSKGLWSFMRFPLLMFLPAILLTILFSRKAIHSNTVRYLKQDELCEYLFTGRVMQNYDTAMDHVVIYGFFFCCLFLHCHGHDKRHLEGECL